jgi:hypothetical protein
MSESLLIDLFAEDRAHEELLRPLLERMARECEKDVQVRVRSARGGHGRVLAELRLYQKSMLKKVAGKLLPDVLVVAIDANCESLTAARNHIESALEATFRDRTLRACPDPHIERWYLADLKAFHEVVGITPVVPKNKCERDLYKGILSSAVAEAGHPPTLGGIEFARELAEGMDFFRAGKGDSSLKHFLDETLARFRLR